MNGQEFEKRLKKLARKRSVDVVFLGDKGAGSHGTLYYGDRRTTLKDRRKEIGKGLLAKMCRDLGVDPSDL